MVVRSDPNLELPESVPGEKPSLTLEEGASLSGHERNHLFLNRDERFVEASPISGLDDPADGRAFAVLDYDRDGWSDLAVVNANAPLLRLFRNELGDVVDQRAGNFVAVRLVGGNREARASDSWSARDGYGAKVRIRAGERVLLREHLCGEGMAAQNSSTLLVGVGSAGRADALEVAWPSGRNSRVEAIETGSLVTVYENPADSPSGEAFDVQRYRREPSPELLRARAEVPASARLSLSASRARAPARMNMYTTMATWCASCRSELPHLELLRSEFSAGELAMFGVPVDTGDSPAKLAAYVDEHTPAYDLLTDLPDEETESIKSLVADTFGGDVLPATVLTDGDGVVLATLTGTPTVSRLRRLIRSLSGDEAD